MKSTVKLLPIETVAQKIGLKKDDLEFYGKYKAKITPQCHPRESGDPDLPKRPGFPIRSGMTNSNLVLVTAMTPGKFGEGKTTVSIGLNDALWRLGKKAIVVLREPSLGPCFGMKGGATGGGKAEIKPQDDINYHFTGDIHAVTYAHNLLSSMIDNSLYFDNPLNIDIKTITWPRVLDLNDRALRHVHLKMVKKDGEAIEYDTRFDISVTSEVMAILCLAKDDIDLRERLSRIVVGFTKERKPVTAKMLKADAAMAFLLKDALKPNLVQTSEGNPCIIHGGPFANIASGTPSLRAIKMAQKLSEYTLVEAGFAADLGGEKFLDIVCRLGNLRPKVAVLIATARAVEESGLENLERHLRNLRNFGLNVVLCINRFDDDKKETIKTIEQFASNKNLPFAETFVYQRGGEGGVELARLVMEACHSEASAEESLGLSKQKARIRGRSFANAQDDKLHFTYDLTDSPEDKILKLCQKIYGAKSVSYSDLAKAQLAKFAQLGSLCAGFYVCLAKTQYSFSDNPEIKGAPRNYTFQIREIRLASGSGFLIPIAGEIMTMPGLPRHPLAENIK